MPSHPLDNSQLTDALTNRPDQLPTNRQELDEHWWFKCLARNCMAHDPADRPTFAQIVEQLSLRLGE